MAIIKHECPHWQTHDLALPVVAWTRLPRREYEIVAHLSCPRCYLPSAAFLQNGRGLSNSSLQNEAGDPTEFGWSVIGFWPPPPEPLIPELLPPDIVRVYLQAERNFPTEGNEEAAGTMYRKALDVGLKKIDATLTGMLGAKIKKLAKDGKLTAELAEWSDHIRDIGNDAAHEETAISRLELIDLRGFTEMVLRYLFTLPNMIKKRRGEKLPWET